MTDGICRSILIDNIPKLMPLQNLRDILDQYGPIKSVHEESPLDDQKTKCALITYNNEESVTKAQSALHGTPPHYFNVRQYSIPEKSRNVSAEEGYVSDTSSPEPDTKSILPYSCKTCGQEGQMVCSVCKVWYCGSVCQDYDWPRHRDECKPPPPLCKPPTPMQLKPAPAAQRLFFPGTDKTNAEMNTVEQGQDKLGQNDVERLPTKPAMFSSSGKGEMIGPQKKVVFKETKKKLPESVQEMVVDKDSAPQTDLQPVKTTAEPVESVKQYYSGTSAIFHPDIPEASLLEDDLYAIITSALVFQNPNEFVVRLKISSVCFERIQSELNQDPDLVAPVDWKPEKRGVVAARYNGVWSRGVALVKKMKEYTVYLVDIGSLVVTQADHLRPLPDEVKKYPACALQVSLADIAPANEGSWTHAACNLTTDFFKDSSEICIKIVGRDISGRLAVHVFKEGQVDLKNRLVMTGFGVQVETKFSNFFMRQESYYSFCEKPCVEKKMETCKVTHVESPDEIYILPSSKIPTYESIMSKICDSKTPVAMPRPGFICSTKVDKLLYRVKVKSFSAGVAEVYFLDQGFTKSCPKECLFTLKGYIRDMEPCVVKVSLNVRPMLEKEVAMLKEFLNPDKSEEFHFDLHDGSITLKNCTTGDDVIVDFLKKLDQSAGKEPSCKNPETDLSVGKKDSEDLQKNSTEEMEDEKKGLKLVQSNAQNRLSKRLNTREDGDAKSDTKGSLSDQMRKKLSSSSTIIEDSKSVDGKSEEKPEEAAPESAQDRSVDNKDIPASAKTEDVKDKPEPVTCVPTEHCPRAKLLEMARKLNKPDSRKMDEHKIAKETLLPEPFHASVSYVVGIEEFYVLPSNKEVLFEKYLLETQDPQEKLNMVKAGEVCSLYLEGLYYRANIEKVSQDGKQVQAMLIDEGRRLTSSFDALWKLPAYQSEPGLVMKLGLAGVKPVQGDEFSKDAQDYFRALTGMESKVEYKVIPQGFVDGTLLVDLVDRKDVSGTGIRDILVTDGMAKNSSVSDGPAVDSTKQLTQVKELKESLEPVGEIEKKSENDAGPEVSGKKYLKETEKMKSRELPDPFVGTITFIHSPDDFFISDVKDDTKFEEILTDIQDTSELATDVRVDDVCGILQDELWSRVRVNSRDDKMAKVTLIDEGQRVEVPVTDLYKLPRHSFEPGLTIQASLAGVKPIEGDVWSAVAIGTFKEIISVESRIRFSVTPVRWVEEKLEVELADMEGALGCMKSALVELECAKEL